MWHTHPPRRDRWHLSLSGILVLSSVPTLTATHTAGPAVHDPPCRPRRALQACSRLATTGPPGSADRPPRASTLPPHTHRKLALESPGVRPRVCPSGHDPVTGQEDSDLGPSVHSSWGRSFKLSSGWGAARLLLLLPHPNCLPSLPREHEGYWALGLGCGRRRGLERGTLVSLRSTRGSPGHSASVRGGVRSCLGRVPHLPSSPQAESVLSIAHSDNLVVETLGRGLRNAVPFVI